MFVSIEQVNLQKKNNTETVSVSRAAEPVSVNMLFSLTAEEQVINCGRSQCEQSVTVWHDTLETVSVDVKTTSS